VRTFADSSCSHWNWIFALSVNEECYEANEDIIMWDDQVVVAVAVAVVVTSSTSKSGNM